MARLKRKCCKCGDTIQRNVGQALLDTKNNVVYCVCFLCAEQGFPNSAEEAEAICVQKRTETTTNYLTTEEFRKQGMRSSDRR